MLGIITGSISVAYLGAFAPQMQMVEAVPFNDNMNSKTDLPQNGPHKLLREELHSRIQSHLLDRFHHGK